MKNRGYFNIFQFFICIMIYFQIYTDIQHQNFFCISFDASMQRNKLYKPIFTADNEYWRLAKKQYDKYVIDSPPYREEARIPKIIHHIWLGSPLPEKYKQLRKTWKKFHPDWEFYLWTDTDVEALGLVNKKIYDATKNYGEKSDIARYEILYRFGGLYVDTDFECLQPFDYLHHCYDFFIGISYRISPTFVRCINALIGASKGHPILKAAIQEMKRVPGSGDKYVDILERTGPDFISQIIQRQLKTNPGYMVLFPMTYFYPAPLPWYFKKKYLPISFMKSKICPESLAIHYWDKSWVTADMVED